MINILVFGHSGFIGQNLLDYFGGSNDIFLILGERDDLLSPQNSLNKYRNIDIVLNLASMVGVSASQNDASNFVLTNFNIAYNACRIANELDAHLIHISSYVYGVPTYNPIDELHSTNASNPYMLSKICSDNLIISYSSLFDLRYTILRPFNLYGRYQKSSFIIPALISSIKYSTHVSINSLTSKRDYLHVFDLCSAIEVVALSTYDPSDTHIFNIGFGVSYSISDLLELFSINFGDVLYSTSSDIEDLIPDCVADYSLFASIYNWTPSIDIEHGLHLIYEYY